MWVRVILAGAALGLASAAHAGSTIADLDARSRRDVASPEGQAYEMKAVGAFWGDAQFMRLCVPPSAPIAGPLTIYAEIKPDGAMGELVIVPKTAVARCIEENTRDRRFPNPPGLFMLKIDLSFTR